MDKLEILKTKSQIANCLRVAETLEGSVKDALLARAKELQKEVDRCESLLSSETITTL